MCSVDEAGKDTYFLCLAHVHEELQSHSDNSIREH
jgi:hypothetical protein